MFKLAKFEPPIQVRAPQLFIRLSHFPPFFGIFISSLHSRDQRVTLLFASFPMPPTPHPLSTPRSPKLHPPCLVRPGIGSHHYPVVFNRNPGTCNHRFGFSPLHSFSLYHSKLSLAFASVFHSLPSQPIVVYARVPSFEVPPFYSLDHLVRLFVPIAPPPPSRFRFSCFIVYPICSPFRFGSFGLAQKVFDP